MALPVAPTGLAATPGDNSASITFSQTAATPAITGWEFKYGNKGWKAATGSASPVTVTGLPNGIAVTVLLRAVNADGVSPASTGVEVTATDADLTNNNGFTDASVFANPGAEVPNLDFNDPDD